jgi:ethanolamine utilization protein EutN
MIIARVIGNVWSTKKKDGIHALRLLLVEPLKKDLTTDGDVIVAADEDVGAGSGEIVILTQGTPAMHALGVTGKVPVDAVVMGIVDSLDIWNADDK